MTRPSSVLLSEVTRRLIAEFQPEQVILFGSYAWGEPGPDSDMDLMVIVAKSDATDYERALRGHTCLSDIDIAKDVVVRTRTEFDFYSQVPASLEHKIIERGKVLYERGKETARTELAH